MSTETILTYEQRLRMVQDQYNGDPVEFARAIEQAVLQSLPYQNSFSIRGDSYAGVYVWAGNENLVQHIPKVLAQTANDPQSMLGAVAAECIQELKRFSELQSPEVQEWKKDAERYREVRRMSLREFSDIYEANVKTGAPFDRLVDAAMEQQT